MRRAIPGLLALALAAFPPSTPGAQTARADGAVTITLVRWPFT